MNTEANLNQEQFNKLFYRKRETKLFNYRLMPLCATFLACVLLIYLLNNWIAQLCLYLALAAITCFICVFFRIKLRFIIFLGILTLLLIASVFINQYCFNANPITRSYGYVELHLEEYIVTNDKGEGVFRVDNITVDGKRLTYKGYLYDRSGLTMDDVGCDVSVYGDLSTNSLEKAGSFGFDFVGLSQYSDNIKYTINSNKSNQIKRRFYPDESIRRFSLKTLLKYTDERTGWTLYSLLFGTAGEFPEKDLEAYQKVSVSHIFAVSGLHIGVLCSAVTFLFRKLRYKKPIPYVVITTLVIFFYVYLSAFSPSSMRALIMCFCMLLASTLGNRNDPISSVAIAFIVLILIKPFNILTVGFVLSFGAVIGILSFYQPIRDKLSARKSKLLDATSVSVAVNVAGFPLTAYFFGVFSPLFLISNLVIVPIMSFVFILIMPLLFLSVIPYVGYVLYPLKWLCGAIAEFTLALSSFSMASISIPISLILFVPWYSTMALCSAYSLMPKTGKQVTLLLGIIICIFCYIACLV